MEINTCRAGLRHQAGVSLVELLLYITISSALMASMYQIFRSQEHSYMTQNEVMEIQQSARAAMTVLTRDIRAAGYKSPLSKARVGFVASLPAPNNNFTINYALQNDMIAMQNDTDGDSTVAPNTAEQIAYRFDAPTGTLQRFVPATTVPGGTWEVVIDHVDALRFVYLDVNGVITTLPQNIRSVEVSLLVRSRRPDAKLKNTEIYSNARGTDLCPACRTGANVHFYRRLLTTIVQARNCAYTGIEGLCNAANPI